MDLQSIFERTVVLNLFIEITFDSADYGIRTRANVRLS